MHGALRRNAELQLAHATNERMRRRRNWPEGQHALDARALLGEKLSRTTSARQAWLAVDDFALD